jgi:hypothetical protein
VADPRHVAIATGNVNAAPSLGPGFGRGVSA